MNQRRSAYIPVVEPFNMPFVSKSIISEKGLLGRFYLIGVYNRLTSYELEIAEFFGNAVSESLSKDPTFIPTRGRLYDNYFIDLIEGTDIHAPERIGEIFSVVGWEPEDSYILAALRRPSRIEAEDAVWILQIHVLKYCSSRRCPEFCQAFSAVSCMASCRSVSERRSAQAIRYSICSLSSSFCVNCRSSIIDANLFEGFSNRS